MYLIGLVSSYVEYVMIRWPDYLVNSAIFVEVSVYRERERESELLFYSFRLLINRS